MESVLMDIAKYLGAIARELREYNGQVKAKKSDSPEYYRVFNEDQALAYKKRLRDMTNTEAIKDIAVKGIGEEIKNTEEKISENITVNGFGKINSFENKNKKPKNSSLGYMESNISKEYLIKRVSHISNKGKGRDISRLLNKYEAIKLSDLKPRFYKEFLREVEGLIR